MQRQRYRSDTFPARQLPRDRRRGFHYRFRRSVNHGDNVTDATAREYTVPSAVDIGHTHLKVADIDRALQFYHGVLGFDITQRYGTQAAFLSAGGYHHHIGLNTWESRGGSPAPRGHTGLYHVAIRYPTRQDLAVVTRRVIDAGITLQGAADHGVSEAIYLADPDGNGIELYWDRPKDEWPRDEGGLPLMGTDPLDLTELLAMAPPKIR
jgi:catechol 2,3-dioxygenase